MIGARGKDEKAFATTWRDRDWKEIVRQRSETRVRERRARRGNDLAAICERMRGGGGPHHYMAEGDEDEEMRGVMAQVDRNRTHFIAWLKCACQPPRCLLELLVCIRCCWDAGAP